MKNYVSAHPNRHHTIPTMMHLQAASEELFAALPAEFSKSEFNAIRSQLGNRGISYASARKYGIIAVVREEPSSYKSLDTVFTDPKGRQYSEEELRAIGRTAIEMLFDIHITDRWFSLYSLPNAEVEVEHPCVKNIYSVDLEKFKSFL